MLQACTDAPDQTSYGHTSVNGNRIRAREKRNDRHWNPSPKANDPAIGGWEDTTTADGAQYGFGVKMDRWSADLANALTVLGCEARTTPQGMAVTSAPSA